MHARYLSPLLLALLLGARHPTPTVVLVKQNDAIRMALPGASQFFVRQVTIGKDDLARIRKEVDFSPEDPDLNFYLGKTGDGKLAGVTLFPQINTMHGPVEVGLTLKPDGTVASVVVTKATVETKPWVEEAVAAGLLKRFQGLRSGDDVKRALGGLSPGQIGQMPYWEAEVIAAAVKQGLVLHHLLFHEAAT
ncbi:MAG TPA: hypothetical protein VGN76_10400 [Gemmatimonadales bacterium]|nr:hypothetical protein [Gemmatimonadales bacterium]